MNEFFLFAAFFTLSLFFSLFATALVRQYAIKKSLIDIPNERSSHTCPTPRGGGVAISLSILLTIIFVAHKNYIDVTFAVSMSVAVLLVSIVGWLDDHGDTPFYWRFVFYSIAAMVIVIQLGGLQKLSIGSIEFPLPGFIGMLITFLAIVWLINLYNFMDGTDALAALQAISAGLLGGLLLYVEGQTGLFLICLVIVGSCLGFLYWNFPPAKIFMGDIGSCVLGISFAMIALLSDLNGAISVTLWCMLLSVFICDATFTLVKRIMKGEKWYTAHRSHAYQRFVQIGMSHRTLAAFFMAINLFFIWPAVLIAYFYPDLTSICALGTVIFMLIIWLYVQNRYAALNG